MTGTAAAQPAPAPAPTLRRVIGPVQLTLYALGSMLGSGIYALIGQAAGEAGSAVWLSFVVAMVAAMLTALSYASISSRYPRASGAAYVAQRAFRSPLMGFVVGLTMVFAGITSVATQARVFAANLADLLGSGSGIMAWLAIGFVLVLAAIVFRGIRESMWVNIVCTVVEAAGLVVIIAIGAHYWGGADLLAGPPATGYALSWPLVLQGATLAFFAFIGFEDTLNVAEECERPERTIPIAILVAMAIATLLYVLVAISAVSVVPPTGLAAAPSPLAEVVDRAAVALPAHLFTAITMFAVGNTALVNYVTASRLVYGMAQQNLLPQRFGSIHAGRRTPHVAIRALLLLLVALVSLGSIAELAAATVLLLLAVFTAVNAALLVLQRRPAEPPGRFEIPAAVPLLGALVCAGLVLVRAIGGSWQAPVIAGTLLGATLAIWLALRPSRRNAELAGRVDAGQS